MLDNARSLNRLRIMNVVARFRNSLSTCAWHTSVSLQHNVAYNKRVFTIYKCHLQLNVRNRKLVLRSSLARRERAERSSNFKSASIGSSRPSPRVFFHRNILFSFRRKGKLQALSLSFANVIASLIRRGKSRPDRSHNICES